MKLCGVFPELEELAHNAEQRKHHNFNYFGLNGKKLAKFTFLAPTKVSIPLNCACICFGVIKHHGKQYDLRIASKRTESLGVVGF